MVINKNFDFKLKYVLYILMIISLFFSIKNKVHALTESKWVNGLQSNTQNSNVTRSFNNQLFKSYGEGQIIYQFLVTGKRNIYTIGAVVHGQDNYIPCQFGSTSGYNDSSTQQVFYSIVCNVDIKANQYLESIYIDGYAWEPTIINWGQMVQFTNFKDNTDYSVVLSNIETMINNNNTWNNYLHNDLTGIKTSVDSILSNMNSSNTQLITQIQTQTQQQHQDAQNTQQKIDDVNNTLKDSSTDNQKAQDTFDNLNSNMATNSTISDLLLMPIHLLQKVLNGLQGSCSAINLGELLGSDFILPCINISDIIGSTLWGIIDVICSGFLAYHIGKRFVVIFNQFTNLKEGGLEAAYD